MTIIERLSLSEFTLWSRDLLSVVCIRESPQKANIHFPGAKFIQIESGEVTMGTKRAATAICLRMFFYCTDLSRKHIILLL